MNLYQISTNVPMYRITSITYAHIHTIPSESQIMGTICYRITKDGHETLYSWFSYVVPTRSNGRQRKLSCRSGSSGVGTLTFCRLVLQCTTLRKFGQTENCAIDFALPNSVGGTRQTVWVNYIHLLKFPNPMTH